MFKFSGFYLSTSSPINHPLHRKHTLRLPIYGAYTELFAGIGPVLSPSHAGNHIIPWGRFSNNLKAELVEGMKPKSEGGTGVAKRFWEWFEGEARVMLD